MTRQFLLLAALRFAKLGVGVASLAVYGRLFGVGREMDAWVFGSGLVAALGMLIWGPMNEITRARYMHHVSVAGEANAVQGINRLLRFSVVVSALVVILLILSKSLLIGLLYPGADQAASHQIESLFAWMSPTLLLGQALAIGSAILNCRGVIYAPEWIGVFGGLVNLLFVFGFSRAYGTYSLVLGFYAGLIIAVAATMTLLVRSGALVRGRLFFWGAPVRDYLKFSSPLFVSYAAGQANGVLEKSLAASLGEGALSSMNYAAQIKTTLQSVITSVLFSLAVPRLAQAASKPEDGSFEKVWCDVQRLAFMFVLMLVPPIFGAADQIAVLLFKTAESGGTQHAAIAQLIRSYLAALFPVALYLVHGSALLARQKGKLYAGLGTASQLLSAALSIALLARLGAMALPLALFVSHGVVAVFMARAAGRSLSLWVEALQTIAALCIVCAAWSFVAAHSQPLVGSALGGLFLVSALHAVLLGIVYQWRRHRPMWRRASGQ